MCGPRHTASAVSSLQLNVDEGRCQCESCVTHASQDLDFTFHRAFDMVRSQRQALETLISCGVPRVLTSGGAQTALQVTHQP